MVRCGNRHPVRTFHESVDAVRACYNDKLRTVLATPAPHREWSEDVEYVKGEAALRHLTEFGV